MVEIGDAEALRRSALEHLWMHNRDWVQMAEEGGPPIIVEGKGIRVTDSEGKSWIDVSGGYASVNVGYGRTEIADAAREQMLKLSYFPQGTATEPLVRLAEKLAEITPGSLERSWPVTGGSEANETAIKIARAYHRRLGDSGRYKIISRRGSYHGATGGVMWLGGSTDRSDYEPAYPGMVYAPQPNPYSCELGGKTPSECAVRCAQAIEDLILFHGAKTVAAVIAEPVSSATVAAVPGDEYWPMLRQICDKHGVLLIADEVICGFGRTGKMFAMEHWDVVPDLMTVAKGIVSSYLPIASAIATREVADVFAGEDNIYRQALTFGGHPVTAAAALRNIQIIEDEGSGPELGRHRRLLPGAASGDQRRPPDNRRRPRPRPHARRRAEARRRGGRGGAVRNRRRAAADGAVPSARADTPYLRAQDQPVATDKHHPRRGGRDSRRRRPGPRPIREGPGLGNVRDLFANDGTSMGQTHGACLRKSLLPRGRRIG